MFTQLLPNEILALDPNAQTAYYKAEAQIAQAHYQAQTAYYQAQVEIARMNAGGIKDHFITLNNYF